MCQRTVIVSLENGLHMVPCSQIAQSCGRHACEIRIRKDTLIVNAKDIFDLLSLNAGHGTELILEAEGDGADEALEELVQLFESNFSGSQAAEN